MSSAGFLLIILVLGIFNGIHGSLPRRPQLRGVYNVDPSFSRWPDRTNIRYYIDSYYTATEAGYIRTAAQIIMANLNGCVTLIETTSSDTAFKIKVTPYDETGALQQFCYSYPGQNNYLINNAAKEQVMIVTRGTNGCLDGAPHSLLKMWAIILGKRNEHQRTDRDSYITMNMANVAIPNAYRQYNISEAYSGSYPYDYCSINHNQPTDYTNGVGAAFTVNNSPYTIPKLDFLSTQDCQIISTIYQCTSTIASCAIYNCASTSTSTCPQSLFCNNSPDESTYLTGPYTIPQTLLLFKDSCVMEYQIDFTSAQLRLIPVNAASGFQPRAITTYFPSPGGPTFTQPPVNLAYDELDPTISFYMLSMVDTTKNQELVCNTGQSLSVSSNIPPSSDLITCPNAAVTPATTASQNAIRAGVTSASSQLDINTTPVMLQYAVVANNQEIALMDATFSRTFSQTTGFLTGQNTIKQITAIQILWDQTGVTTNQALGVFGTGSDGRPYFGVVQMLLTGSTTLSLADTTQVPRTWAAEPVLLSSAMSTGC